MRNLSLVVFLFLGILTPQALYANAGDGETVKINPSTGQPVDANGTLFLGYVGGHALTIGTGNSTSSYLTNTSGTLTFTNALNTSGGLATYDELTTYYAPLTSPSFTTPSLGVATATSINGLHVAMSTGTLTIANGKNLAAYNTLSFYGTDGSSLIIGGGGTLNSIAYMSLTGATTGEVPTYNGSTWTLATPSGGSGSFTPPYDFEAPTTLFTAGSSPVIGIDDNGNPFLESLTGNVVLGFDGNGSLEFDNNVLLDISTTPVQLNYPGLGSSEPLADGDGYLYYSSDGGNLTDSGGNIYYSYDNGLLADNTGNLYAPGLIYAREDSLWASPTTRIIYDQYTERAFSTLSDSWNTDSETTLISDPDYGYVSVNGSLFVRDSIQMQSFGGSTQTQINNDGSASFANGQLTIDVYGDLTVGGPAGLSVINGTSLDNGSIFTSGTGQLIVTGGVVVDNQTSLDSGAITTDGFGDITINGGSITITGYGLLADNNGLHYSNGDLLTDANSLFYPPQFASDPSYVKGALIFNTTLNKLRVGGATGWETVASGNISGSASYTASTTGSFVVTIGQTMANTAYKVLVTPTCALGAAPYYVSAKTTTSFTVTYPTPLTGTETFDWSVLP